MGPYQRILFPTDYSPCATHAFPVAVELARTLGAELHVIHIIPPTPREGVDHAETLRSWISSDAGTAITSQMIVIAVSPDIGILDCIESQNADLVVMGTHGGNSITDRIIGSVTERIIRLARCPVLTINVASRVDSNDSLTRTE